MRKASTHNKSMESIKNKIELNEKEKLKTNWFADEISEKLAVAYRELGQREIISDYKIVYACAFIKIM